MDMAVQSNRPGGSASPGPGPGAGSALGPLFCSVKASSILRLVLVLILARNDGVGVGMGNEGIVESW